MSIAFAERALQRFLSDCHPEVLCVKGKWGVGKTYAWKNAIKIAACNRTLSMTKYAYVSLFGVKDSSDIMQSIYVNVKHPYLPELEEPVEKSLGALSSRMIEVRRKAKSLIGFTAEHVTVPHVAGLAGVARAILSGLVGDTLGSGLITSS